MKSLAFTLLVLVAPLRIAHAQTVRPPDEGGRLKVILVGTAGGPTFSAERLGISTLVVAGTDRLLFDAGRSMTTGLSRLGINPADLTKVFLTHLHSDHVVSLPELFLFPWASQGRSTPLQMWGPTGTRAMMEHLRQAFDFDIHVRRDLDEKFPPEGIIAITTEIREGVVYDVQGVKVTAFLVDHGPVQPAFGYRVDYGGHSVVLSGDTGPSDNLINVARGTDLLIHEVGRWKQDPVLSGPAEELAPGSRQTRGRLAVIAQHHTDGAEAGRVFARVQPKLAVFSHSNPDADATLRLVRQAYDGPVVFGEDLMAIDIGDTVSVTRFGSSAR